MVSEGTRGVNRNSFSDKKLFCLGYIDQRSDSSPSIRGRHPDSSARLDRTQEPMPRSERQCRVTPRLAVWVTPPADAEILTEVELLTLLVETVKLALWAPARTVTLAGTLATPVLLLASVTTVPPDGATSTSDTVPCDVLPPLTEVGLSANEAMVTGDGAGFTLSVADSVALPAEAVMVTRV
jgi:hypothetical protein